MRAVPLASVDVGELSLERFAAVLRPEQLKDLHAGILDARNVFAERRVWNVSSTSHGGGVAEMLTTLLAYARGIDIDARWEVIGADTEFFIVTKRIHNRLHGYAGDEGPLGDRERKLYEQSLAESGEALARMIDPRDLIILHDPQTAGLIPLVQACGVPVVWRCHIGVDHANALARDAWHFLEPYVSLADAAVFSRSTFVWDVLDRDRVTIITPSLDAFAPKNQLLDDPAITAILQTGGILHDAPRAPPAFVRMDGSVDLVRRSATVTQERPLTLEDRYVLQVSRWDALKDPAGVIAGFVQEIAPRSDVHLVCAGPETKGVVDDPEGASVLDDLRTSWAQIPRDPRSRVHLAVLPMSDPQENAAIVNALQRAATVVVQKSLAEGFGLTVAEAMWKARPVVASGIGGIQDQIENGRTGLLLKDPRDLRAYGKAVNTLLADPRLADQMGEAGREQVRDKFLGPRSLLDYLALLKRLLNER